MERGERRKMVKRMILASICVVTVMTFLVKAGYSPEGVRETRLVQQGGGCASCHAKLSEKVPEGHFKVTLEEVKYCVVCHTLGGPATAFDWTLHRDHFSRVEFTGDCWSCHVIDGEGKFRLIGVTSGEGIATTREKVEKQLNYFRLWARSQYLGQTHAQRGVTCQLCHGTFFPEKRAEMDQCLTCHGSYKHLAELTMKVYPNPHESHYGELQCRLCHKVHAKSELYCDLCHTFGLNVP